MNSYFSPDSKVVKVVPYEKLIEYIKDNDFESALTIFKDPRIDFAGLIDEVFKNDVIVKFNKYFSQLLEFSNFLLVEKKLINSKKYQENFADMFFAIFRSKEVNEAILTKAWDLIDSKYIIDLEFFLDNLNEYMSQVGDEHNIKYLMRILEEVKKKYNNDAYLRNVINRFFVTYILESGEFEDYVELVFDIELDEKTAKKLFSLVCAHKDKIDYPTMKQMVENPEKMESFVGICEDKAKPCNYHIGWFGPPAKPKDTKLNTTPLGQDTQGAKEIAQYAANPVIFWCLDAYFPHFKTEFKETKNINVLPLETFLKSFPKESEEGKRAQQLLEVIHAWTAPGRGQPRDLVGLKDLSYLFFVYCYGGYAGDSNVRLLKKQPSVFKRYDSCFIPMLNGDTLESWLIYANADDRVPRIMFDRYYKAFKEKLEPLFKKEKYSKQYHHEVTEALFGSLRYFRDENIIKVWDFKRDDKQDKEKIDFYNTWLNLYKKYNNTHKHVPAGIKAIDDNNLTELNDILDQLSDINNSFEFVLTNKKTLYLSLPLLHWAVYLNKPQAVKAILAKGADALQKVSIKINGSCYDISAFDYAKKCAAEHSQENYSEILALFNQEKDFLQSNKNDIHLNISSALKEEKSQKSARSLALLHFQKLIEQAKSSAVCDNLMIFFEMDENIKELRKYYKDHELDKHYHAYIKNSDKIDEILRTLGSLRSSLYKNNMFFTLEKMVTTESSVQSALSRLNFT